ncbi:LytR/AlgR family response regulator transcription factor [Marinoscillum pacificum]|uniref:LytR/AlgR family response regulator transcription factor n=1 Tax=Marinoscillum pacificum TaxID=392723 RepID=UPI0021580457|nr:LytTR family DNA-binding domain-containing protein [Marinoscillum pacificum]
MNLTCIIVEDQAPAQRILKKYISDLEFIELKATFSNATKALDFLNSAEVDLIFLDIHLPKMSGMDFLKIKPKSNHVILTTAYSDYALESYEYNVVDYLLKPFSFQRFVQAVSKVQELITFKQGSHPISRNEVTEVFIKSGYDHIKLVIDDILFIKSDGDYTELHCEKQKHLSSEPLKFWINFLNTNHFIQIHKSFLVNLTKISKVSGNRIFLVDNQELPIGRVYKDTFTEKFLK